MAFKSCLAGFFGLREFVLGFLTWGPFIQSSHTTGVTQSSLSEKHQCRSHSFCPCFEIVFNDMRDFFVWSKRIEASGVGSREHMTEIWLHLTAEAQWELWRALTEAWFLSWAGLCCTVVLCLTLYLTQNFYFTVSQSFALLICIQAALLGKAGVWFFVKLAYLSTQFGHFFMRLIKSVVTSIRQEKGFPSGAVVLWWAPSPAGTGQLHLQPRPLVCSLACSHLLLQPRRNSTAGGKMELWCAKGLE